MGMVMEVKVERPMSWRTNENAVRDYGSYIVAGLVCWTLATRASPMGRRHVGGGALGSSLLAARSAASADGNNLGRMGSDESKMDDSANARPIAGDRNSHGSQHLAPSFGRKSRPVQVNAIKCPRWACMDKKN